MTQTKINKLQIYLIKQILSLKPLKKSLKPNKTKQAKFFKS